MMIVDNFEYNLNGFNPALREIIKQAIPEIAKLTIEERLRLIHLITAIPLKDSYN